MAEEDFDSETEGEGPKALRDQNKKLNKELAELKALVAESQAKARKADLAEALNAKGVSPKLAKFYNSDDTSAEAVDGWLKENADVFGIEIDTEQSTEQAEAAKAQKAMRQLGSTPGDPAARMVSTGDPNVGSPEEWLSVMKSNLTTEQLLESGLLNFTSAQTGRPL